jgi:hypothetical protein
VRNIGFAAKVVSGIYVEKPMNSQKMANQDRLRRVKAGQGWSQCIFLPQRTQRAQRFGLGNWGGTPAPLTAIFVVHFLQDDF